MIMLRDVGYILLWDLFVVSQDLEPGLWEESPQNVEEDLGSTLGWSRSAASCMMVNTEVAEIIPRSLHNGS
jgi:hypothetical protein